MRLTAAGLNELELDCAGAAPGSWSVYLSDNVNRVIAVDRAELMAEAIRPNILHLRQLAQEAVPDIIRWNLVILS